MLLAILALLALACSPEGTGTQPVRERLVSVGPELSQLLVELGVGPQIVATDRLSLETLPPLAHAVDLGDPGAPSIEAARAARPERVLVLAGASDPAAALARRLGAEGVAATVLSPLDANAVIAAIHRVGGLVERELRAAVVAARRTREVTEIAVLRDGRRRLRAVWVLERDPLVVVGGAGLRHELLEFAGAENAFHGAPDPRRTVSREALLACGADVMVGAPPLPALPADAALRPVVLDPELVALPLLDLPGRVRALHDALYPAAP